MIRLDKGTINTHVLLKNSPLILQDLFQLIFGRKSVPHPPGKIFRLRIRRIVESLAVSAQSRLNAAWSEISLAPSAASFLTDTNQWFPALWGSRKLAVSDSVRSLRRCTDLDFASVNLHKSGSRFTITIREDNATFPPPIWGQTGDADDWTFEMRLMPVESWIFLQQSRHQQYTMRPITISQSVWRWPAIHWLSVPTYHGSCCN